MIGDEVGPPALRRSAGAEITVGDGRRQRPRRLAGNDVASVVADVQRALWRATEQGAGMQDRQGRGLGLRRRVAADHAGCARAEAECLDQRIGVARPFVGDDPPGDAPPFQAIKQFGNAVEEGTQLAQPAGVDFEEARSQALVVAVRRLDAESGAEQPAYALRGRGAQTVKRRLRSTFLGEQKIGRAAQVGRGGGEGTGEGEKYRLKLS